MDRDPISAYMSIALNEVGPSNYTQWRDYADYYMLYRLAERFDDQPPLSQKELITTVDTIFCSSKKQAFAETVERMQEALFLARIIVEWDELNLI